ncbi:hypothetical protein K7X08_006275 [Anisodus acutangulus]|uniref:F-box domain-containing protein n=1 Tax=Anisodus acutangulus TaxID=402998 RepID=A0A9Q1RRU2_9SOLA|nr:hypothetical protein K7X08_006275 [Anisodus acutangulus]
MSPSGKRHACRSVPLDILNILPEKAIDDILMRLPLREAVRTSILSKNWRYKWCRLPELKLDQSLWNLSQSSDPTPKFKDIVYHLLTLHAGPLTKFTLSVYKLKKCPKIDNLIYFLSRNDIQHLVLKLPRGDPYKLPSSIFKCLKLRHLCLWDCIIQPPPPAFKGFASLISLELGRVKIPSVSLGSLISTCPLLKELVLFIPERSNVIEINAPMLRSFKFTGSVRSICLKTVPRLAKLELLHYGYFEDEGKIDIAKFFESFSALEHLHLNDDSLKLFARAGGAISKRLPYDLNCVKRLHLDFFGPGKLEVNTCALCLIRSFPCLQYMEIKLDDEDTPALECLEEEAFSDVTFDHLREVKVLIGEYYHIMPPTDILPSDVLSDLLENVFDDILNHLPFKDAARTSFLSKKWRYDWGYGFEVQCDIAMFFESVSAEYLEQLVLRISSILSHIQIKAPKLRSFDFTGSLKSILLKKEPLLVKLVDTGHFVEAGQPDLAEYFSSFPALEHLHLNYFSVQFLAAGFGDIAAKFFSSLNCLKCLWLSDICLDELAELSHALSLIRSSTYLQEIQMKVRTGGPLRS